MLTLFPHHACHFRSRALSAPRSRPSLAAAWPSRSRISRPVLCRDGAGRVPTSEGIKQLKKFSYPSRKAAQDAAEHVGKLLDLARNQADSQRIGDMLQAVQEAGRRGRGARDHAARGRAAHR